MYLSFTLNRIINVIPKHLNKFSFFFFNDTATTEIYTLSLHDALPISPGLSRNSLLDAPVPRHVRSAAVLTGRSEEHTSELQSRQYLVCRLLLEKKKKNALNTKFTGEDTGMQPRHIQNYASISDGCTRH